MHLASDEKSSWCQRSARKSRSVDEVSIADSFGYGAGGLDQAVLLGSQQQLQERGVVVAGSPHRWHHRNTLGENSLHVWASVGDLQQ